MLGCCSCLDNFSLTCWHHRGKVSFRMRSPSLSALMRAFAQPPLLIIVLLIVCMCVFAFAAVAHVHGGLQRSECASSRQSQLLKDDHWLQQRDIWKQTKRGHACQRTFGYATLTLRPGVRSCSMFCSRWSWSLPRALRFETISPDNSHQKADVSASGVLRNSRMYVDEKH